MKKTIKTFSNLTKKFLINPQFFFLMLICLASISVSLAQSLLPGSLDPSFGNGGIVIGTVSSNSHAAKDVAVQNVCYPDNTCQLKTVVIVEVISNPAVTGNVFHVLRYNLDGSLDTNFGTGGVAKIAMTPQADNEPTYEIAIQRDGKIIVAGSVPLITGKQTNNGFALTRLTVNGQLDTAFASGGRLLFTFSSNQGNQARSVTIQPIDNNPANDRIVVAGNSGVDFAVARLLPNGAFDLSFNGSGKAVIQMARSTDLVAAVGAYSVKIQPSDNKIVVGGMRGSIRTVGRDFAVMRLNFNGSLDNTFGSGGVVFTDLASQNEGVSDLAIDGDGNIVVAGRTQLPSSQFAFALLRYTPYGQLDPTFNGNGRLITTSPGFDFCGLRDVQIDGNRRIVAAGQRLNFNAGLGDFTVMRVLPTGILDTSFGGTGMVFADIPGKDDLYGMTILPDGRITLAGGLDLIHGIALARYIP